MHHHDSDEHATEKPHNDVAGCERQHKGNDEREEELASGSNIGAVNTENPTISSQWKSVGLIFDKLPNVR